MTSPFAVSGNEQRFVDAARDLAPGFAARAHEHDAEATVPVGNLTALHEAGLDMAAMPEERGGSGLSYQALGEIFRVVGKACPSTACVWMMHLGAAQALVSYGPPVYAEALRAGKRFANALSEPTGGNLFLMPLQRAEPADGGHVLDGAKRFVSGCEIADHFLVNALLDDGPAFFGVSRDDSVEMVPIWDSMGLRGTRSQLVHFRKTLLRSDNRCRITDPLAPNIIALGLPWLSIGIAEATLDALTDHARSRVVPSTGRPVGDMQWVHFDAADAHVKLLAARTLAERAMWLADHGDPGTLPAAVEAKLYANQVAKDIAEFALRVGGGSGYLRTSPIQRHFRDAQAGALMAFSTEVCRDMIGRQLMGTVEA
ncbi:acyl-CoA dehydrogenase family protein [Yinghuangia seranimata]|uniref:acyl-CoA dehydrogenase family protein n=1 Tax=Yinghuangia seranimata TaxID=408067 RepID=UPI00248AE12D|nr:acyl-CoA dehydrogenase family protein [Yinghuangia seranimata]MDI2124599.1 acyl-CoA dehydrogenase family protein [Yinghuangia seranimata]